MMHITKESINEFTKQFMLSYEDVYKITNNTIRSGQFVIIKKYDIVNHMDPIFPKVLSRIINEYYNECIILDYTLKYPYYSGYRSVLLSMNCDELQFNHDIECGIYVDRGYNIGKYLDMNVRIQCPLIHEKRINTHNRFLCFLSNSYNNNIHGNIQLYDWQFNFGLLLDHIINKEKSLWGHLLSEPIFVTKQNIRESTSTIHDVSSNIIHITHPNRETIKLHIVNEHNLNICIDIHMILFDLIRDLQNTYYTIHNEQWEKH